MFRIKGLIFALGVLLLRGVACGEAVVQAGAREESPAPPQVLIEWLEPPRELAQGKITLKARITAKVDAQNLDWIASYWIAEGSAANFVVYIVRIPATGKATALPPAVPRGIVGHERKTLYRDTTHELVGEFALNNEPGEYELYLELAHSPGARSETIRVSVKPGRRVDLRK